VNDPGGRDAADRWHADLQDRLDDLEVKLAYMEDAHERLNEVVVRQQNQIDLLLREVSNLQQQAAGADLPSLRSLRDDLPPHY
jgi:SlyX protein